MTDIKIVDYKGYEVFYSPVSRLFEVRHEDDETVRNYPDQTSAEAAIDRRVKSAESKAFPIPAIGIVGGSLKLGKITSYDSLSKEVWFSVDKPNTDYGSKRGKYGLIGYSREHSFYPPTAHNVAIVAEYNDINGQIAILQKRLYVLSKGFTDPITEDTITKGG